MDLFQMFIDWETCTNASVARATGGAADGDGSRAPNDGRDGSDESQDGSDGDQDDDDGLDGDIETSGNAASSTPNAREGPTSVAAHQERQIRLKHFKALIARTGKYIPKPVKDHFAPLDPKSSRTIVKNSTTAFALTARITYQKRTIDDVSDIYQLPSLLNAILSFYGSGERHQLPFGVLDCWNKIRMQLHTHQDTNVLAELYTVAALPPNGTQLHGFCNFVLVKDPPKHPYRGIQGGDNSMYFT